MKELFPESIRAIRTPKLLFHDLLGQCNRDLQRAGFSFQADSNEIAQLLEELAKFLLSLSEMERARLCYVADIPDAILRAAESNSITEKTLAEAFIRRSALKVVTRLQYPPR